MMVNYTAHNKSTASRSPKKLTKPSTRKNFANPKKLLESARKNLLHLIIDQILMGREEIKIPKNTHPHLQDALQVAGTPVAWASSQKEFGTLQKKKVKQRSEQEQRKKHGKQTTSVTIEVKSKKALTTIRQPAPASKSIPTDDDINRSNRMSLIRSLVSQMIKKQGPLTVPNLDQSSKPSTFPIRRQQRRPRRKRQSSLERKGSAKKECWALMGFHAKERLQKVRPRENGLSNTVTPTRSQNDL